jgi:phosphoglycolate phosphatase
MSHELRAVMFDLDGTLVDTIADIAAAMNLVLERNGYPQHPAAAYRTMVGSGLRELVRRATAPEEADVDRLAVELHEAYRQHPVGLAEVYPGIAELLSELRRRGVVCTVLSNKADDLVRTIVSTLFEPDAFRVVRGMRDDVPGKPDPAGAHAVLTETGIAAEQTLYLGDSDVDMETARRAGMLAVGAAWGFRGAEELRAAGADVIVDRPLEVLGHFGDEGES